jgi:hypothetical protein
MRIELVFLFQMTSEFLARVHFLRNTYNGNDCLRVRGDKVSPRFRAGSIDSQLVNAPSFARIKLNDFPLHCLVRW